MTSESKYRVIEVDLADAARLVDWKQEEVVGSGFGLKGFDYPWIEVAYVWCASWFLGEVQLALHALKLMTRYLIIWGKPSAPMSRGHYHWQHEPCWYAVRDGATAKWIGDRKQTTLWELGVPGDPYGRSEGREGAHPTQKPVEAMARPLRNHEGDVFDPFLGSGTTIVAAEQLKRACYGIELRPDYCDVIVGRWQNLTDGEGRLEATGQTFAEVAAERVKGAAPKAPRAAKARGKKAKPARKRKRKRKAPRKAAK